MERLPLEIKNQDRKLRQIKREGQVALYGLYGPDGDHWGYEVVIVQTHPAETILSRSYPERESYPSSSEWGTLGWTYLRRDKKSAEEHFTELVKAAENVHP